MVAFGTGEFKIGISVNGQSREHATLVQTLAVKQLSWSSIDVFVSCERMVAQMMAELSNYIKKVGYNPKSVVFMPISRFNDDNILEPFASMPRFRG
ncbi:unnamed protein product [Toxocara canis]|uniref:Aldo_ket_red domain-containing protein n=1 Tax=Toxocara canis TaxID=6265 RepID=A0A183VG08_TOXCA|nr:unnamed protein product [Toxocara canis]